MTDNLKSTYLTSTRGNIEKLIVHLEIIGGKKLTVFCRRQNAFKVKWTNREIEIRNRCHVQNAAEYLQSIKDNCLNYQIRTVIADIAIYVSALDKNEDVSFILLSTNILPSAIHFDIAKSLFFTHQIRDKNQNNYDMDLLAIYALRLSLESRIKGLLGIDYAISRGRKIGLSSLIEVSKGLKNVIYSNEVNWAEIEWINEWINHHMHRHIRPYPWIIFQAIESLKSFVDPKDPFVDKERTVYSFYSATYVQNEEELQEEVFTTLKQKYSSIEIKWLSKREIIK
jgi:hypothetical protein